MIDKTSFKNKIKNIPLTALNLSKDLVKMKHMLKDLQQWDHPKTLLKETIKEYQWLTGK